jgi:hypothetical protein
VTLTCAGCDIRGLKGLAQLAYASAMPRPPYTASPGARRLLHPCGALALTRAPQRRPDTHRHVRSGRAEATATTEGGGSLFESNDHTDEALRDDITEKLRARGQLGDGHVVTDMIVITKSVLGGDGGRLESYRTFQLGHIAPDVEIEMAIKTLLSIPGLTGRGKAALRAVFDALRAPHGEADRKADSEAA